MARHVPREIDVRRCVAIAWFAASLVVGCKAGTSTGDRAQPPARAGEASLAGADAARSGRSIANPARPGDAAGIDDERARAIREAEDFVRAQGYTDAPPSVTGSAIVAEGIEGTLEQRRGMLEPRALRASGGNGEWTVIFRYVDVRFAGRARALRLRAGRTPTFAHQDLLP